MLNPKLAETSSMKVPGGVLMAVEHPRPTAGFTEYLMVYKNIKEGGFVASRTEIPITREIYDKVEPMVRKRGREQKPAEIIKEEN